MAQGFPDWGMPQFVIDSMDKAINNSENQYIRVAGHPNLVTEIAKTYGKYLQREIDPLTEVEAYLRQFFKSMLGYYWKWWYWYFE